MRRLIRKHKENQMVHSLATHFNNLELFLHLSYQ